MPRIRHRTYAFIFSAIFLFSTIFVFSKKVIPPLNSFSYLFLRSMFGTVAFTILIISGKLVPSFIKAFKVYWKQLLVFSIAFHLVPLILTFIATPITTATDQTIINNINLSFVVLLSWLVLKQKPTWVLVGIVAMNFLGALITMMPLDISINPNLVGNIIMLISVFIGAFFPLLNKELAEAVNPFILAYVLNLIPFLILLPINIAWQGQIETILALDMIDWLILLWIGIGVSAFAYCLGNLAYQDKALTPELYSIFTSLIPIGGILWDVFIFQTQITIFNIFGAILVISSVILVQFVKMQERGRKEKSN